MHNDPLGIELCMSVDVKDSTCKERKIRCKTIDFSSFGARLKTTDKVAVGEFGRLTIENMTIINFHVVSVTDIEFCVELENIRSLVEISKAKAVVPKRSQQMQPMQKSFRQRTARAMSWSQSPKGLKDALAAVRRLPTSRRRSFWETWKN